MQSRNDVLYLNCLLKIIHLIDLSSKVRELWVITKLLVCVLLDLFIQALTSEMCRNRMR